MGSSTDFAASGTRRLVVNGVYWALGLEDAIPAGGTDVDLVGPYHPTDYGFGRFQRGFRPSDHVHPPAEPPAPRTPETQGRLAPGDRFELEIEGIGILANRIVKES